jgi:hypothetical protein
MDEVLAHALVRKPEPIVWDEGAAAKPAEKDRGRWFGPDRALTAAAGNTNGGALGRRRFAFGGRRYSPKPQHPPHESLAKRAVWANARGRNGQNAVDSWQRRKGMVR